MPSKTIQWFPGHMAKTRRMMQECLSSVDILIELLDARIPFSSRNPEIFRIAGQKPILTVLNKSSLADPERSRMFAEYFKTHAQNFIFTDCVTGEGFDRIMPEIRNILSEKLNRYKEKGLENRRLKAMVVGIPNVGKSTFINRLAGAKKAKAEDRPGVTVNKQWVPTTLGIDLLDMPGVLWPRFEDRIVGENLAMTGAIKDGILDIEEIAMVLCGRLRDEYNEMFCQRYKLNAEDIQDLDTYDLLTAVGKKRGMLVSGGDVNMLRAAETLLDEFRAAKIGRITLEIPKGD